jgi:hypothetical protein
MILVPNLKEWETTYIVKRFAIVAININLYTLETQECLDASQIAVGPWIFMA